MQKLGIITALLAVSSLGWAQDQQAPPPDAPPQAQGQMGGRGMRGGPGVAGTITAISDSSITVKTRDGKTEQVNLSGQTRFRKERQDAKLADFKVPKKVVILTEIPVGATGKLQRIGLAQKLGLG